MATAHEHHGIAVRPERAMFLEAGSVILAMDPMQGDQWSELVVRVNRINAETLELTVVDCLAGPQTMGACAERTFRLDELEVVPLVIGAASCDEHREDED